MTPSADSSCSRVSEVAAEPEQGRTQYSPAAPATPCLPSPTPRYHGCLLTRTGCTLTAAVLSGDVLSVAHVGDSAAVLDCGAEVVSLTTGRLGCKVLVCTCQEN